MSYEVCNDGGRMAAPQTRQRLYSDSEAAELLRQHPNRIQGSSDPNEATAQTVRVMCDLVRQSIAEGGGIVESATENALAFRPGPNVAASIWWWAKLNVKFLHHQQMLERWMGLSDELQLLIRPDALLRMERPKGDCAVFTTLICAMLDCAGIPWEIVTVAVDPRIPGVYSHVYPRAIVEGGARLVLDASHGLYPGWEVPRERVTALQVWNEQGNPIPDMDSGYRGLHGVSMRGLGQDGVTPVDTSQGQDFLHTFDALQDTSSGGGASPWGSLITSLANQWTQIGSRVIAPTTEYVRGADGSLRIATPADSAAGASLIAGASAGTGTNTLLIFGGLAVAAVVVIMLVKK